MEFYHGTPYWPTMESQPSSTLQSRLPASHYDVLIVGTGMSGSLCALTLARSGLHPVMLDERALGTGSSSANTGLLQYSNDVMLCDLIQQIGEKPAVRFYRLCLEAINQLEQTAQSLNGSCDFFRRKSFYYASALTHVAKLKKEYTALLMHGFPVRYLNPAQIESAYGFSKHGAMLTTGDAEVNPLKFCRTIHETLLEHHEADILGQTSLLDIHEDEDGVSVQTTAGSFRTSAIIFATGYAPPPFLNENRALINRTYAIATAPVANLDRYWPEQALIWETRRPYLYLRTTVDQRIIAGGLDEKKNKLPDQQTIDARAARLKKEIEKLFPNLPITVDYAWGALFGESIDNLPYIGRHPKRKHLYYLLGYGGNGTVYSMLGSIILRDLLLKGNSPDADLLRLDR